MEPQYQPEQAGTLGQQLRFYRIKHGLTLDELALPEFSVDFVVAVEQDVFVPSLLALALLAERLDVAPEWLPIAQDKVTPDIGLLEQDLAYQLDQARRAADTDRADYALRLLEAVTQSIQARWSEISAYTKFRLCYLRGLAFLRLANPDAAQRELDAASALAAELEDDGLALLRARNLLGAIYFQQDQPLLALKEHEFCAQAITSETDKNLRLLIYSNLASDHQALGQPQRAIGTYKQALELLDQVNNLEREAAIYWGMSVAYVESANVEPEYTRLANLGWAKLYAAKAIAIYEAAGNKTALAQMRVNLAEILIKQRDYDQAEQALQQSYDALAAANNPVYEATILEHFAELELQRGRLEQSREYAQQGLQLVELEYNRVSADPANQPGRGHMSRTYIRLLRVSARSAEKQLDYAAADAHLQKALELAQQVGVWKTASDAAFTYAETLAARAMHQQAGVYYRLALKYAGMSDRS